MPILEPDRIDEVVELIRGGGIAAIPTDTVYGLATLPAHEDALRALADLKGRDADQPIAVLIDSAVDVMPYLAEPGALDRVMRFWPGPLTAVVRAREGTLPVPVVSTAGTIGVRKPDDQLARYVIRHCGGVLAVTSANRHGQAPLLSAEDVADEFGEALVVLDGGPRDGGVASTVVDLASLPPRILRPGPISAQDLGIDDRPPPASDTSGASHD